MHPLVSIIIPTYNYAQFIIDAINSVLQQDYPKENIEIIVVDDGSKDNTREVLNNFIENNTIQYFFQQNEGKASATYKAIQQANGKYMFNLDADDYFLPGKLKQTVNVFETDEAIVHVASPAKQVQADKSCRIEPIPVNLLNKELSGKMLLSLFIKENMLYGGGSTYAARAAALKQICIPPAVDMYIDEFLVLAILPYGNSFFIPDCLSVWRGHHHNYSGNAASSDIQLAKTKRLLKSSGAVLEYLQKQNFDPELVKIYKLKDITRRIAYKESCQHKTINDIGVYAKEVFFNIRPGIKAIRKYQVINRMIPTRLFNFLKKIQSLPRKMSSRNE
jgi:glycosyltransferase involved in cell wall biosynthesis